MRARVGSAGIVLCALGVVCALALTHADEVGAAFAAVSAWTIAAAVALHLATLALRSEAWRLTLTAAHGDRLPRPLVHAANATAFVAGAVQSQATLPVRVAMLKRLAAERAPGAAVICVADAPIVLLELGATALLLCGVVIAGGGPWWIGPAFVALTAAVWAATAQALERRTRWPLAQGIAILADRPRRRALVALSAGIVALTLARVWVVLAACGLPHGATQVVSVYAALGVFGLLPIGAGAAPSATLAALGTVSVGAAVAAGLLLGASSIVAVLVYAALVTMASRLRAAAARRPLSRDPPMSVDSG